MITTYRPTNNLLDAKLNPPSASSTQVTRTRVTNLVCSARASRLVLIRAPTGFGKTTAMLQCHLQLEQMEVQTAWLTLDQADNDAARFLHCLGAALGDIVPDAPGDLAPDDAVSHLVSRLARYEGSFVLFIDEFEVIREQGVQDLVREIIQHLPRNGQIVIGTRNVPDLGLGRLRARGHLLEIDADQLRFSVAETEEYITGRRGIELNPADLLRLHQKTEGWIAGLWLASAALARHEGKTDFIARFSGSNSTVTEYLTEDVLNLQLPEVRDFLLRTSILKHLSPSLCRALVPQVDSAVLLTKLEADNILITRIEGEEHSYRYHSLFAGFLQAQLAHEAPEELSKLHRAAAHWFEQQQRWVPAIDHTLEGGDIGHAIALLAAHALGLLEAGRMRLLSCWFDLIPASAMVQHAHLQIIHLWAICCTRGPWEAMARLRSSYLESSTAPDVWPHVMALRPMLLAMMDRTEEAYTLGMESLAKLPSGDAFADSTLLVSLAWMCSAKNLHSEALQLLDLDPRLRGSHADSLNHTHFESVEGMVALFEGRLREATARFRIAVSSSQSTARDFTNGNAWAGILYTTTVYERNDLAQATTLLRVYVPLVRDIGFPDHVTLGYRMLSRIAFEAGDVDQAFQILAELEWLGRQRQLPRVVASARLERSRAQLLQGHAEAAQIELERASDPSLWAPIRHLRLMANDLEYPELTRLRWEAQVGDAAAALKGLDNEINTALAARRHHRALKLNLLRAVSLERGGDRAGALSCLHDALRTCCDEGFVRIVLDEGPTVGILVRQLLAQAQVKNTSTRDPIFIDWLQHLVLSFGSSLPEQSSNTRGTSPEMYQLDSLTQKEMEILKLLGEGYSNSAMAEKLFVSESTVCTHLRNIYSKFGVRSRMQAVRIGRGLGLLS